MEVGETQGVPGDPESVTSGARLEGAGEVGVMGASSEEESSTAGSSAAWRRVATLMAWAKGGRTTPDKQARHW